MFERTIGELVFLLRPSADEMRWTISTTKDDKDYKTTTDFKPLKPCREEQIMTLFDTQAVEVSFVDDKIMLSIDVPLLAFTYVFALVNEVTELEKQVATLTMANERLSAVVAGLDNMTANGTCATLYILMVCSSTNCGGCGHMGRVNFTRSSIYASGKSERLPTGSSSFVDVMNSVCSTRGIVPFHIEGGSGHALHVYCRFGFPSEFISVVSNTPEDLNFVGISLKGCSDGHAWSMMYYLRYRHVV